jgi:hypothetical protein
MPFTSETAKEAKAKAAGRGESKIKKWIREAADKKETIAVFQRLTDMAKAGDMDAIKTFMSYVVGKPTESLVITGDPEKPVKFILDGSFKDGTGDNS